MNRAQTLSHWLHSHGLSLTIDGHWRDYYQLTKPKVVALLLLTALVGAPFFLHLIWRHRAAGA